MWVEDSIGTQWVLESMVVVVDENIVGVGGQQVGYAKAEMDIQLELASTAVELVALGLMDENN